MCCHVTLGRYASKGTHKEEGTKNLGALGMAPPANNALPTCVILPNLVVLDPNVRV